MILKGQDDGEGRGLEGTLCYSLDHLLKAQTEKKNDADCTYLGTNVVIAIKVTKCTIKRMDVSVGKGANSDICLGSNVFRLTVRK